MILHAQSSGLDCLKEAKKNVFFSLFGRRVSDVRVAGVRETPPPPQKKKSELRARRGEGSPSEARRLHAHDVTLQIASFLEEKEGEREREARKVRRSK